ncbi:hypothetical protein [Microseira sp. BLCC-F43]|jgi:uncharacterized membrane-anchored protein YjiN (DUF445 family)|uniref:hypothetical protein n=1 Tax=Microseira sp. BLCC-F43 TaxID=3153602 RepID=UPI0035BA288A
MPYFFTVQTDSNTSIERLIKKCDRLAKDIQVSTTVFILAQRVKKKVKGLFQQIVIHLARILGEPVAGKPLDHQDDPDQDRSHWWGEIKNFIKQIQAEKLSEAQLRKILEDAFTAEEIDAVIEALNKASEIMGESTPTLFQ